MRGDQCDDEAGGVHDHVPASAASDRDPEPESADQLGDNDGTRDRERPPEALGRGPRVGMIVGVAAVPAALGVRVVLGVGHGLVDVGRGGVDSCA